MKYKVGDVVIIKLEGKYDYNGLSIVPDMRDNLENQVGIISEVDENYDETYYKIDNAISREGHPWSFLAEWLERFTVGGWH